MSTKLTRQTMYQFGSTVNAASEVGEFGSGATGLPVYTGSITLMQSLAAWNRGWAAETIANNRPFLEDMNAVDCVFGYQLTYLFQEGMAEYDASTIYFINSMCQSSGTIWQVINDGGGVGISGTMPSSAAQSTWRQVLPHPYIKCSNTQSSGVPGGSGSTGAWSTSNIVPFNTKDFDTAGICSLSANQITLPPGTYKIFIKSIFTSTNNTQTRLYNLTGSAILLNGTVLTTPAGEDSVIMGQITLAVTTTLIVEYQIQTHSGTSDFGAPCSFGTEVYAQAEFIKWQ